MCQQDLKRQSSNDTVVLLHCYFTSYEMKYCRPIQVRSAPHLRQNITVNKTMVILTGSNTNDATDTTSCGNCYICSQNYSGRQKDKWLQ